MVSKDQLKSGAVVVTNDGKIAIVIKRKPQNTKYPVIYKFKTNTRGYKGNEKDFQAVLGVVDVDAFNDIDEPKPKVSTAYDNDALVPDVLKGVKIGDKIEIRNGLKVQVATYEGYNPRRPKNCVSISMNGKQYKGPLGIVVGKANGTPSKKRSEGEIMKDILGVYVGLSTENLHCDGEISYKAAMAKKCKLEKELKALFKELGREVSENEAYGLA